MGRNPEEPDPLDITTGDGRAALDAIRRAVAQNTSRTSAQVDVVMNLDTEDVPEIHQQEEEIAA